MSTRINLRLNEELGLVRSAYADAKIGRVPQPTEFYIDTGAPVSVLSPELTERMQIPVRKLDFKEEIALGGSFIEVAIIDPIRLTFYSEDTGSSATVEMPIYVSDYVDDAPKDVVDNILGLTFFTNTSADLHVLSDGEDRVLEPYLEF